jgi:type VI secretion system protein ImpL
MKKFFSWLLKPAVLSFLGVLLLALLIWFEAPLLSWDGHFPFASETVRWSFIVLFFLWWALWLAWRRVRALLANRRLAKGVAGEDAELTHLTKRMQEAIAKASAAPATATGGSPTKPCCSTPPAATPPTTAMAKPTRPRGQASSSCCASTAGAAPSTA